MRPRHLYEDHDHGTRQGRALQKRLPIHFEVTRDPIFELVFTAIQTALSESALGGGALGYESKFWTSVCFASVPSLTLH